jgi:hypothetical protein
VIGPLAAGVVAVAVAVGLTVSWQVALGAGLAVIGVRLLEDYVVVPRVLGHATLVDVIVRDKNPAEEEVPTLLFPAKDAEA